MEELLFATSNTNKVSEANKVGQKYGIVFSQVNVMYPEVRAENCSEVAEEGVRYAYSKIQRPIVVEDSGLFIEAFGGFPGPYSSFVQHKLGNDGILKLMDGVTDRRAKFISAIGYFDGDDVRIFEGVVDGFITCEKRGGGGFGYDPIFMPEGSEKTFAEDHKRKNEISHRSKATELLCRFLKTR